MTVLRWAIAFWLAAGLTAFTAWSTWTYATKVSPQWKTDRTAWLVYRSGQGFIWLAAIASAGAVFGVAARAAWTLVQ
jgi:hypothetical protein